MPSRLLSHRQCGPGERMPFGAGWPFLDVRAESELIGGDLQASAFGYQDVSVAVGSFGSGLMWANMLRAFQVGNARTSHVGPWSWIRESRVAWAQVSWPACHLTNASASAVMKRSSSSPG